MLSSYQKTFESIFKDPVQSNIKWTDIESLFKNLGADISEGNGSRVRIVLHNTRASFHRPHPQRETDKGAIMSVRKFLILAGVTHEI